MNESINEKPGFALLQLERMKTGLFPFSECVAEKNSDLNDSEIRRSFTYIHDVIYEVMEEIKLTKQRNQRPTRHKFPTECLSGFVYEGDKSIMIFVEQLKSLAGDPNVKGPGTKKITDWLKAKGYLAEEKDTMTGSKITVLTEAGKEAGLYTELRSTRFDQEYEVIMYSEKAQKRIVESMSEILG